VACTSSTTGPGLQGRGELVRRALEDAGADYVNVARSEVHGGVAAMTRMLEGEGPRPFAPPFLKDGTLVLSHVANILLHPGLRLGLVASDEASRHRAHQIQLEVTDLYAVVHDTDHPIRLALYYEEQKAEALGRTKEFVAHRLPKFLGWFERTLGGSANDCLLGGEHSYDAPSLFQVVGGLRYAGASPSKAVLRSWSR
jgi:glutathione S-transferase